MTLVVRVPILAIKAPETNITLPLLKVFTINDV